MELAEKKEGKVKLRFEKRSQQFFLTQDYFEALSVTNLKARIGEYQGKIEISFDVSSCKDYEILGELICFGEKCCEIKARKTSQKD